jgi:protein-tyrosine phosphatase
VSTILIVCTGNICRSPMAEGLLRRELAERGIEGVLVESAGISGWDGSPATVEAVEAMAGNGIDISAHLGRRLSRSMVSSGDLILAMAAEHRDGVAQVDPRAASRTFTLKELVNLLEHQRVGARGTPGERIREAVELADGLRRSGAGAGLLDEDVADPLGLSLPAFQAAAWELGELTRRLVDRLFGEGPVSDSPEDAGERARVDVARQRWERLGAERTDGVRSGDPASSVKGGPA